MVDGTLVSSDSSGRLATSTSWLRCVKPCLSTVLVFCCCYRDTVVGLLTDCQRGVCVFVCVCVCVSSQNFVASQSPTS